MEQASPVPVDVADVTVLVDTFVDVLLASTEPARRAPLAYEWSEQDQLRAEHGFADGSSLYCCGDVWYTKGS